MADSILIGADQGVLVAQALAMSNRHGLVAGATGTGKTVTLQVLAEGFSAAGVPVFAVDVKGDLSGIAMAGKPHKEIDRRLSLMPIPDYSPRGRPTMFWDIYGEQGHPVRTTISEVGPLILGNLLDLNDTQSGILYAAFKIADDQGLLLLDLKDLRSMLAWMSDNASDLRGEYGNISSASIGAIQRSLLVLEEQGADRFFGEPALDLKDFMRVDFSGLGVISLLDATRLLREAPRVYAAFLLWLLSELFEDLPEVGDPDKPKLVLFFDEAHLLFDGAPKSLLDKIEQVVRLIRSKGVGVYFVTQSPLDLPEDVLGQLGLKIEHALRAFTPKDRKVIKAVAASFRTNAELDVETVITELERGEALVSTLDVKGAPTPVARTLIRPPESRIGPLDAAERTEIMSRSPAAGRYDQTVDRESAHEKLVARAEQRAKETAAAKAQAATARAPARSSNRQGVGEAMMKSAARAVGSSLGRRLIRGLLGSLLK
jgi:DNA helicase HerA-like ATPase